MPYRFENQLAVITGGAAGIGRSIASALNDTGARVAILDLETIETPDFISYQGDVSDPVFIEQSIENLTSSHGEISILVNSAAALNKDKFITEMEPDEWFHALNVNVSGVFFSCRAVIPSMLRNESGVILNIASQLAHVAVSKSAAYCATKGAVLQLTRALALDYAEKNVRVNSISPGAYYSERMKNRYGSRQAASKMLAGRYPMGRIGDVSEMVSAALYLLSSDAKFVTGSDLIIDGGYTAQ